MKLIDSLQIKELHAVVGASLGGLLALTTILLFPQKTRRLVSIASGLKIQPLQVIHNFEQVKAIENLFTTQLSLSPWMILILMQLSFLLMGTFLDDTAMLVIVAPLYVPLVGALGFDLVLYGVLYTITCQIAYMTPPFGYNLFLMRAMAPPEIGIRDIYSSITPVSYTHLTLPTKA